ncbi:hypothetical protein LguiB_015948 [Lonicera macranthoides]
MSALSTSVHKCAISGVGAKSKNGVWCKYLSSASASTFAFYFEGFNDSLDDDLLTDLSFRSYPPPTTLSHSDPPFDPSSDPPFDPSSDPPPKSSDSSPPDDPPQKPSPSSSSFDCWDEDEFEGLPLQQPPPV